MNTFIINEAGKNGTVTLTESGLERTLKRRLKKDDTQFIPWRGVESTVLSNKKFGRSIVTLRMLSGATFEWKTDGANEIVNAFRSA